MNSFKATLPTAEEAAIAKISSQKLSAFIETTEKFQPLSIIDSNGASHTVNMPVSALHLLINVLTELGDGNTVRIVPIHAELTTQEGADLLNISRPTFIKLLDDGVIPFSYSGNRRKVKFVDVHGYREAIEAKRMVTLNELSELDQELGLGY